MLVKKDNVSVVQRIEHNATNVEIGVRILTGTPFTYEDFMYRKTTTCNHCSTVVEYKSDNVYINKKDQECYMIDCFKCGKPIELNLVRTRLGPLGRP